MASPTTNSLGTRPPRAPGVYAYGWKDREWESKKGGEQAGKGREERDGRRGRKREEWERT